MHGAISVENNRAVIVMSVIFFLSFNSPERLQRDKQVLFNFPSKDHRSPSVKSWAVHVQKHCSMKSLYWDGWKMDVNVYWLFRCILRTHLCMLYEWNVCMKWFPGVHKPKTSTYAGCLGGQRLGSIEISFTQHKKKNNNNWRSTDIRCVYQEGKDRTDSSHL